MNTKIHTRKMNLLHVLDAMPSTNFHLRLLHAPRLDVVATTGGTQTSCGDRRRGFAIVLYVIQEGLFVVSSRGNKAGMLVLNMGEHVLGGGGGRLALRAHEAQLGIVSLRLACFTTPTVGKSCIGLCGEFLCGMLRGLGFAWHEQRGGTKKDFPFPACFYYIRNNYYPHIARSV